MAQFTAQDKIGGGGFGGDPGIYRCKFTALDPEYVITDKQTGEEVSRFRWVFQSVKDTTTAGELDTLTTPNFKPRTNGLKLLTGMLGRPPKEGDDTDKLVGRLFDVVWGPNQNGRLTITAATRVQDELEDVMPKTPTLAGAELP
jgi:hypothetical protein